MLNWSEVDGPEAGVEYLVIGDPIGHSRSPGMQNAAFEACGLGRPYGRLRVAPDDLGEFVELARRRLKGVNLTVPHKHGVLPFLDWIDPEAAPGGSVNTLVIRDGLIRGFSTDGAGLEAALTEEFHKPVTGASFLFLGAGGAAHATAFHLAGRGAGSIVIANRTGAKAAELADGIAAFRPGVAVAALELADTTGLRRAAAAADFIIQATSLGLRDTDPPPIDLAVLECCRPDCAVFDTIYRRTPLLERAAASGLAAAGGRAMLIHQGARSFELWTGRPAPLEAMRRGFDTGGPAV